MATKRRKPVLQLRTVFVDTSAWYAYINRADPDHITTADFLKNFPGQLVTSNYVFDELITLVRARMGHAEALQIGVALRNPEIGAGHSV